MSLPARSYPWPFPAMLLAATLAQASPCSDFCRQQYDRCSDYHCTPVTMGCAGGCSIFFTNNPNQCVDLCANEPLDACQRRALEQAARCWQPCWQQKGGTLQQWGNCMKPCGDLAKRDLDACRAGSGGNTGTWPPPLPGGGGQTPPPPASPPPTAPSPGAPQAGPGQQTAPVCPTVDLSGVWQGSDGGLYYLRQYGSSVWWYGEPADGQLAWSHAGHGSLLGGELALTWADVPKGRATRYGSLNLRVENANTLVVIHQSGGFAGSRLTRVGVPDASDGEGKKRRESWEDRLKGIFR